MFNFPYKNHQALPNNLLEQISTLQTLATSNQQLSNSVKLFPSICHEFKHLTLIETKM